MIRLTWCLTVFLLLFLATSSVIPFLCIRRYTTVQAIFRGFFLWRKRDSDLALMNLKTCRMSSLKGSRQVGLRYCLAACAVAGPWDDQGFVRSSIPLLFPNILSYARPDLRLSSLPIHRPVTPHRIPRLTLESPLT